MELKCYRSEKHETIDDRFKSRKWMKNLVPKMTITRATKNKEKNKDKFTKRSKSVSSRISSKKQSEGS